MIFTLYYNQQLYIDNISFIIQRNEHLNKDLTLVSTSNFLWEQAWSKKLFKDVV